MERGGKVTQTGLGFLFLLQCKNEKRNIYSFSQKQILYTTKLFFMGKATEWHWQICTDLINISQTSLLNKLSEFILAKKKINENNEHL